MVEYDNLVTFELARGLRAILWRGKIELARRCGVAIICRNDWNVKALNVTDSLEFES